MADRELLELAAKAAGRIPKEFEGSAAFMDGVLQWWNPLNEGAEALRLAAELRLWIVHAPRYVVVSRHAEDAGCHEDLKDHGGDALKATMRAIVRAAAEIGKATP